MHQINIKICGLTRIDDVKAAVAAGADAVGFVFAASPRRVSAAKAMRLVEHVPDGILRVGLFLDQGKAGIEQVLKAVPLDVLQFHGSETEQHCSSFGIPYLKSVAMVDGRSAGQAEHDYPGAMGLLLDSHRVGGAGGSGRVFDWTSIGRLRKQVWLAGGLHAGNVGSAIRMVKPYAVDVSSGVEASAGIKDAARISAFVRAVRLAVIPMENESQRGKE